jgi:hypothetical protein
MTRPIPTFIPLLLTFLLSLILFILLLNFIGIDYHQIPDSIENFVIAEMVYFAICLFIEPIVFKMMGQKLELNMEGYKLPAGVGNPFTIRDHRKVINSLKQQVDTTTARNTELEDELKTTTTRNTELELQLNSKKEEQSVSDEVISEQDKAMKMMARIIVKKDKVVERKTKALEKMGEENQDMFEALVAAQEEVDGVRVGKKRRRSSRG